MINQAQVKTQAKMPVTAARAVQLPLAVPEHEAERLDIATQMKGASQLGHRLGSIRVEYGAAPAIQRRELSEEEQEKPLQGKFVAKLGLSLQKKTEHRPNLTALPDNLKAGVENLSGLSLDDVRVHYNSPKPAAMQALAYTRGTEIHVGPGQERHLPHEAWHVVQQAQDRVKPTLRLKSGTPVNDDNGLEHEADLMGARALQTRDEDSGLQKPLSFSSSVFQKLLQRRALSVGAQGAGVLGQAADGSVVQLVQLDVGHAGLPHSVRSQADVQAAAARGDTLFWPQDPTNKQFNGDYSGSVLRAMTWGLLGGEGTGGWTMREYLAGDFDTIAAAAGVASNALVGIAASLDNEKNKTLIAIRAFRGPNNGAMAGQTQADLALVHAAVAGQAAALHAAGLINDPAAAVTAITADPAEAHPNTLPTAQVVFGGAGTVYFKGRGRDVENALIGSAGSAAHALSSLAGANPAAAEGVGMHGFVNPGVGANPSQIAGDVGAEVAPALAPVTTTEKIRSFLPVSLWGADVQPRLQAVAAWLSAAKGALLASLTATTDLHPSNIKAGRSGKSHLIDGEFLLDVTQWQAYQNMLANGNIVNFEVGKFVPPWLRTHMTTLSPGTKTLMANAVVAGFNALGADKTHVWAEILAPIRALIATPALLRVIPLGTDQFLAQVTAFHNTPPGGRGNVIQDLWNEIVHQMNGKIVMNNAVAGMAQLTTNFENGMVPLFHVQSNNGAFLLNKNLIIGNTVAGRGTGDLLILAGSAVSRRYAAMAAMLHAAITA